MKQQRGQSAHEQHFNRKSEPNSSWLIALIFHQVEFAPPVGYVEPERQEKKEEKKEEEVQYLLEE